MRNNNVIRKLSTFKTIHEDVKEDDKSSIVLSTHKQTRNDASKLKIQGKSNINNNNSISNYDFGAI